MVSDVPCLDLVNTEPLENGARVDLLQGVADLVAWLRAAGVLTATQARETEARWVDTAAGKALFASAIELRTALRSMVERIVAGKPVSDDSLAVINRVLARRQSHRRLVRDGRTFRTHLVPVASGPLDVLVPVAESAANLLEHRDPTLIKQCENPSCVLYFYDTTKNHSRRWCRMEVCGSRIKAAAYYRRTRARRTKPGHAR